MKHFKTKLAALIAPLLATFLVAVPSAQATSLVGYGDWAVSVTYCSGSTSSLYAYSDPSSALSEWTAVTRRMADGSSGYKQIHFWVRQNPINTNTYYDLTMMYLDSRDTCAQPASYAFQSVYNASADNNAADGYEGNVMIQTHYCGGSYGYYFAPDRSQAFGAWSRAAQRMWMGNTSAVSYMNWYDGSSGAYDTLEGHTLAACP